MVTKSNKKQKSITLYMKTEATTMLHQAKVEAEKTRIAALAKKEKERETILRAKQEEQQIYRTAKKNQHRAAIAAEKDLHVVCVAYELATENRKTAKAHVDMLRTQMVTANRKATVSQKQHEDAVALFEKAKQHYRTAQKATDLAVFAESRSLVHISLERTEAAWSYISRAMRKRPSPEGRDRGLKKWAKKLLAL